MAETLENRSELKTVTPMMRQYLDVKEKYEGFILLYRLGDFYEPPFDPPPAPTSITGVTTPPSK